VPRTALCGGGVASDHRQSRFPDDPVYFSAGILSLTASDRFLCLFRSVSSKPEEDLLMKWHPRFIFPSNQKRSVSSKADVRFTPNSGHRNSVVECPLCAKSGHMRRTK